MELSRFIKCIFKLIFKIFFIYVATPGILCGIKNLYYSIWDLVPQPRIELRTPALGTRSLTTGPPRRVRKSP